MTVALNPGARPEEPAIAASSRTALLSRALVIALVVAAGLSGALLRVWILGRERTNSDEAIVGLMAREILRGHFFAFYWGQHYGGGEPYVVSLVFALFGQSSFTLRLTPVLLDAVATVLLWRIGKRLFSPAVGATAALLFWVFPETELWQSTLEYGFRLLTLDCGLGLVLVALQLGRDRDPPRRPLQWCALGALVGLGWWCSPEIAYFALPALGWLTWRCVARRAGAAIGEAIGALVAAAVADLPWLWSNLRDGFASLHSTSGGGSFSGNFTVFRTYVLPILLGLRLRISGKWLFGATTTAHTLGDVLYLLLVIAGAAYLIRLVATRRAALLVAMVVLFPLIYAGFPQTWFWRDGRYAIYGAPIIALIAASGAEALGRSCWHLLRRHRRGGDGEGVPLLLRSAPLVAIIAVALAATLVASTKLEPYRPEISPGRMSWFSWRSDPNEAAVALAAGLERDGIHDAYAGYWVAYVLDFEARGALIATNAGPTYVRYQPYLELVEHSHDPAWIFADPRFRGQNAEAFSTKFLDLGCATARARCLQVGTLERWLSRRRTHFSVVNIGSFTVVRPGRPTSAAAVLSSNHLS